MPIRSFPGPHGACRRAGGFSLIELMIAVGLSLMILAGLVTVFVNNSNTRREIERTARQIESGRYGTDLLSNNIAHAAFFAEFDPTQLSAPVAIPQACSTVASDIRDGMAVPIHGYRNATTSTPGLGCLEGLKDNTDVVVVRRVSTCVAGTTGCDVLGNGAFYYFQASLCNPNVGNAELAGTVNDYFRLDTTVANLDRHARTCLLSGCDCTTPALAAIRRYHTHIYYVANNNVGTDGVPTLKRAELTGSGFSVVPLVEGIENLKLEYGIDTTPRNLSTGDGTDGTPDAFTPTPDTYACTGPPACNALTNWRNVTVVRAYLLARNVEPSLGYTDSKTYTLDSGTTLSGFGDAYRRHVFSTTVKLSNVTGRRGI